MPKAIVLAGINGAGKTTASRRLLAETLSVMSFVNADTIARGLNAFAPESVAMQAGRVMLQRLDDLAAARADFALETTLAARTYAAWLKKLRDDLGYAVELYYFWLRSADLAVSRVAGRVATGGHHVPEPTIRQRYGRSTDNFMKLYRPVADLWKVYDNSGSDPELVAEGRLTGEPTVVDASRWQSFTGAANHG